MQRNDLDEGTQGTAEAHERTAVLDSHELRLALLAHGTVLKRGEAIIS